jgi:xanthine dehydrogenase YagR molybdenum-binding subunit
MHAHGAVFAEVKVDPDLGQIRTTRVVGAFAAGRIIIPRMVESQLNGGMIWGVSFALHEQAVMDPRSGRPTNANLAEYHIPVNADVPSLETILVEEHDPHVTRHQGRGRDRDHRHGRCSSKCCLAATGVRVRKFPISLDRLIDSAR